MNSRVSRNPASLVILLIAFVYSCSALAETVPQIPAQPAEYGAPYRLIDLHLSPSVGGTVDAAIAVWWKKYEALWSWVFPGCYYKVNYTGKYPLVAGVTLHGTCGGGPDPVYATLISKPKPARCPTGFSPKGTKCWQPDYESLGMPCPDQCEGNPINVGIGNKFEDAIDYRGNGPFPLIFRRAYNSIPSLSGGSIKLAIGWSSNIGTPRIAFTTCYIPPSGGNSCFRAGATIWRPSGRATTFTTDYIAGSGDSIIGHVWHSIDGDKGALTVNESGFSYARADGITERYGPLINGESRLISITDRSGLTHTFQYDNKGNLSSESDSFGRKLLFTYDGDGRLATMTNPDGGVYSYSYDTAGRLVRVTYPDLTHVQYLYEDKAYPFLLTGLVDENGNRYATWGYDEQRHAVFSQHGAGADTVHISYGLDGNGEITSADVTEATGLVRHLDFQRVGGVNRFVSASAPCIGCGSINEDVTYDGLYVSSKKDFNGTLTTYTRDDQGLELARTEAAGTAAARTITTVWNKDLRLPQRVTYPDRTVAYTYNTRGQPLQITVTDTASGKSRIFTFDYYPIGLLASVHTAQENDAALISFTYDSSGNVSTIRNALGQTTHITRYNADGYPLAIIDPNGVETDLAYDARQRIVSRTVDGNTTRFKYDPAGELIHVTLPTGAYLHYRYDAAHRLTDIDDNLGNRIEYTLDALGNHVRENAFDPNGALTHTLQHVYDNLNHLAETIGGSGQSIQYVDDPLGNPTSITDPLQHVTAQSFDALNRLSGVVDPLNGRTTFAYDSQNRPTEVTDPRGLTTRYAYDAFGDLVEKDSPDTGTTTYTYDAAGNRLTQTDARGITTTYTYDALNRVTGIHYPDSSEDVTYTYDQGSYGIGHLTGIQDESGTTSFQYDARGNVIQKAVTVDSHSFTVGYQYDAANELVGITYPDGMHVNYQRDAAGRVTGITAARNGVTQTVASDIAYEPFGPVTSLTYGNGLTETRHYDQAYRLTSLSVPGVLDWTLGSDADDDIISITDNLSSGNSQAFGYDALNRLTVASGTYGSLTYGYDGDGNRTTSSLDGTPTAYGYDSASNRLLTVGSKSYQYDATGNLISDGAHTYLYNDAGRLTGYDAHPDVYLYNGLGQRVRKPFPATPGDANGDGIIDQNDLHSLQDALKGNAPIIAGMDCNQDGQVDNKDKACIAQKIGDTKNHGKGNKKVGGTTVTAATTSTAPLYMYFVYDEAGHLLGEYDDSGNLIQEHIWLGSRPVAVSTPTALNYVTTDQLGRPRAITNQSQQLVWQWRSDPFGNGKPNQNPSGLGLFVYNLRSPGQYYDAGTGHNYNYCREYDPAVGRYMRSDPIGLAGGINTYGYVGQSPLSYIDTLGLAGDEPVEEEIREEREFEIRLELSRIQALTDKIRFYNPDYRYVTMRPIGSSYNESDIRYLQDLLNSYRRQNTCPLSPEEEGGLVIGKMDDLANPTGWRSGDYTLYLPSLPPGPERWAQNERELQYAIDLGRPIRDASPTKAGGFLDRERNLLIENGWRFDPATGLWNPGH